MTTKQKAAIAVAMDLLENAAKKLEAEPATAKVKAMKELPSPLGTSAFEAGWLGSACVGTSREMRAVLRIIGDAFPSAAKLRKAA